MIRTTLTAGLLALLLAACGGANETKTDDVAVVTPAPNDPNAAPAPVVTEVPEGVDLALMAAGGEVYGQYCIVCHQQDGNGVTGVFPPMTDPEWIAGDDERLISVILNGLEGKIEVSGETYNQAMPAHDFLTDEEVAGVLTYVRNSFGNAAGEITPEQVAAQRGAE
ncbi:MAG: cytochrome c [Catalinimonas sp.]